MKRIVKGINKWTCYVPGQEDNISKMLIESVESVHFNKNPNRVFHANWQSDYKNDVNEPRIKNREDIAEEEKGKEKMCPIRYRDLLSL